VSVLTGKRSWMDERTNHTVDDRLLAVYLAAVVALVFVAIYENMWHWFVLPNVLCGILIGPDAIRWVRGEHDLYDPKGLVGAFGWYFFFLAPLLFIGSGRDASTFDDVPDWRTWVGYLGLMNAASLILYQGAQHIGFSGRIHRPGERRRCEIDIERAWPAFLLFGGAALFGQAYYMSQSGGIAGIIQMAAMAQDVGRIETTGLGLFQYAGSSLPTILLIGLTLLTASRRKTPSSLGTTILLLLVLGVLQFLVGGFTGSRSATVWSILWITGIVHSFWRSISRRVAAVGMIVILAFMYIYGFYKSGGVEAIWQVASGESFQKLEETTGRTFEGMMLGDLARVDVQAYQLFRLYSSTGYKLRWGKTYASALLRNLPSRIWPGRPPDPEKTVAGTELLYGPDRYVPGDRWRNTSKVFGLTGEAMLNFGVWLAPAVFAPWGFLVGRFRRATMYWPSADARRFLSPLLSILLTITIFSDFDNLVSVMIDKAVFITILVFVSSRRTLERVPR
jgi:hypothetical protein